MENLSDSRDRKRYADFDYTMEAGLIAVELHLR
jgi:hypothetical protein